MPPRKIDETILNAALVGLEIKKQQIESQMSELRQMLSGDGAAGQQNESATAVRGRRGRRRMSASARERIAEAQRKRWAAQRGESQAASAGPAKPKAKRKLSAAGRRAIIEATKRRWAKVRAAKKAGRA